MRETLSTLIQRILKQNDLSVVILGRHGEKNIDCITKNGRLTTLGERQVEVAASNLMEHVGKELLVNATFMCSPVQRVRQSAEIAMKIFGVPFNEIELVTTFEWGPDDGDSKNITAVRIFTSINSSVVVAFGHNGLWEKIAQAFSPIEGGYKLGEGEYFVIKINNNKAEIKTISHNILG